MIPELKKNIEIEMKMLEEIADYSRLMENALAEEKKLITGAINSLKTGIKILNSTLPDLLDASVKVKKLSDALARIKKPEISNVRFAKSGIDFDVALKSKDRARFMRELSISEKFITKFKKGSKIEEEKYVDFKASRGYLKISNRLFLETRE